MNSQLIEFYRGDSPDIHGRFLQDILQWPDERLESQHDFIQWLFPLTEPSQVYADAPLLDLATIDTFRNDPQLKNKVRTSLQTMLRFYGFSVDLSLPIHLQLSAKFAQISAHWLSPGNHNLLRITRILKSLRLLGLDDEARAFYEVVASLPRISDLTRRYWSAAAKEPLEV